MFSMLMSTVTSTANEAISKSLQVFWQGMLAICVVIGICILTTKVMTYFDREAEKKNNDNEN